MGRIPRAHFTRMETILQLSRPQYHGSVGIRSARTRDKRKPTMTNERSKSSKDAGADMQPVPDSTSLVVLTSVPNESEAAIIVAVLSEHGIRSISTGEFTAGFRAEVPGQVSVTVSATDLIQAREILAQVETESDEIDWSQVDVGEPAD